MATDAQALQGRWDYLRGEIRGRWAQLTDEDLQALAGDVERLIDRIRQKTGEGPDAIERFLDDVAVRWSSRLLRTAEVAGGIAHRAEDRIREDFGRAAEEARVRYARAEEAVRERPGPSVLAAFGVGLAAGLVVAAALRSR